MKIEDSVIRSRILENCSKEKLLSYNFAGIRVFMRLIGCLRIVFTRFLIGNGRL